MNASASEFYQDHLDRVSRSFAFCIRQLPDPLRDWIGLSYLLCRIVDTIEDSVWSSSTAQLKAFQIFDASLNSRESCVVLKTWMTDFPAGIPDGEVQLINDAHRLLSDFHEFPPPVHEMIRELVLSMSLGMQHFCAQRHGGDLRLSTLAEVNQYCFFVAGVVGELLVKLVSKVEPRLLLSQLNILRAHHFGLFLQKVNLLKDQVGDERVGRHLIPSRQLVEDSSQENATQALDFLLIVPKEQLEFRRFCAWSLFLGLEALSTARASITKGEILKVPRLEVDSIIEKVESALTDDKALSQLFESFTDRLGWKKNSTIARKALELPDWITKLYRGPLDSNSLTALGI